MTFLIIFCLLIASTAASPVQNLVEENYNKYDTQHKQEKPSANLNVYLANKQNLYQSVVKDNAVPKGFGE